MIYSKIMLAAMFAIGWGMKKCSWSNLDYENHYATVVRLMREEKKSSMKESSQLKIKHQRLSKEAVEKLTGIEKLKAQDYLFILMEHPQNEWKNCFEAFENRFKSSGEAFESKMMDIGGILWEDLDFQSHYEIVITLMRNATRQGDMYRNYFSDERQRLCSWGNCLDSFKSRFQGYDNYAKKISTINALHYGYSLKCKEMFHKTQIKPYNAGSEKSNKCYQQIYRHFVGENRLNVVVMSMTKEKFYKTYRSLVSSSELGQVKGYCILLLNQNNLSSIIILW